MANTELQTFITKVSQRYWISKKVSLNDNFHDIPEDYKSLNMLINWLKDIKQAFEKEKKPYLDIIPFLCL